jgi:hypothetical protein
MLFEKKELDVDDDNNRQMMIMVEYRESNTK